MRTSHLLVEVLDTLSLAERWAVDTARWPACNDVGHLEWDCADGRACCFCHALLLPGEMDEAKGTLGSMQGKFCCKGG